MSMSYDFEVEGTTYKIKTRKWTKDPTNFIRRFKVNNFLEAERLGIMEVLMTKKYVNGVRLSPEDIPMIEKVMEEIDKALACGQEPGLVSQVLGIDTLQGLHNANK